MAISLARAGAGVVVTSRSEQKLDNTIAHLPQPVAERVVADVDDPDAGKRLYAEAVHPSGAIDAVINNVGTRCCTGRSSRCQSPPSRKQASTRVNFRKPRS